MKKLPKISIIIPSFNKVDFIEETLKSIIFQKYPNLEVVIQDGGSTDGTLDIIKRYAKKYPKIITYVSKKDKGQLDAINKGLKKAKGEIITYINADDVYEKGALKKVGETFKKYPDTLWLAGKGRVINEEGEEVAKLVTWYKNQLLRLNKYTFLLIVNYLMQPSIFLSRKAIKKYGPFTGTRKFVTEYDLWLKLGKIKTKNLRVDAGRHAYSVTALHRGKPYGWKIPRGKPLDIHLPATIREAARRQDTREKPLNTALRICFQDIREKLRVHKAPLTMVFVVDLSGSMLLNLNAVTEALLQLHKDAYRFRDRVGIVALKGFGAVVVQHPTVHLSMIANKLLNLRISGYTPLAAGMLKAWEVIKETRRRDPSTLPIMVIISDGSANVPLKRSIETGEFRQIEEIRVIVREYEDIAVRDVISVSKLIKSDGINTIVINTNPHLYGRETYGFYVTKMIAEITGGNHYAVGRLTTKEEMIKDIAEGIKRDQRKIVLEHSQFKFA